MIRFSEVFSEMLLKHRFLWIIVLVLLLATGVFAALRWKSEPVPQSLKLPDGTEAFFLSDSQVIPLPGYPQPRDMKVNGNIFFRIAAGSEPLIMRSRLLVLTVTEETALRITAWAHETGEQVEVLSGHVVARKSYESPYSEPDTLEAGQMVMINDTIDLMEKEKFDPAPVKAWSEQLMAAARAHVAQTEVAR